MSLVTVPMAMCVAQVGSPSRMLDSNNKIFTDTLVSVNIG